MGLRFQAAERTQRDSVASLLQLSHSGARLVPVLIIYNPG